MLIIFSAAFASSVYAGCSPYIGQATLNEFFKERSTQLPDDKDFVEVKILNSNLPATVFNDWTIKICEQNTGNDNSGDGCSTPIKLSNFDQDDLPWIVLEGDDGGFDIGKHINTKAGFDAVLADASGNLIDYFTLGNYTDTSNNSLISSCALSNLLYPYDYISTGASAKSIWRNPDGTGNWSKTTSGSDEGTGEDTNDTDPNGDTPPIVSVNDVAVNKGDTASFTFTLEKQVPYAVSVSYRTTGGSAVPDTDPSTQYDYTNTTGTVTFPANTTTLTATVTVATNATNPSNTDEVYFFLNLYNQQNAKINNANPVGTIRRIVTQDIILSTGSTESLGGLTNFENGSLVRYVSSGNSATLYFNEDQFTADENISAVHVIDARYIVLSTGNQATLGGLTFNDGDLVRYDAVNNVATLYLSESKFSNDADISAVYIDSADKIYLSTTGNTTLGGLSLRNGDIAKYDPVADTATLFFNQDNLADSTASIDGFHLLESGNLLLSTTIGTTLAGLTFRDGDIVEYNPVTNKANLYFNQDFFSRAGADINALTLPATTTPSIHHIEFIHDASALTCKPESIQIKACVNSDCSSLATSSVTVNVSPDNGAPITWRNSSDTVTESFTFTGSENITLQRTTTGTITLGADSISPTATNTPAVICKNGSGTDIGCNLTFHDTGFIFSSIPTQTSCAQSSDITISAVRKSLTSEVCENFLVGKTANLDFSQSYNTPSTGTISASLNYNATDYPLNASIPVKFDGSGQATFKITYADAGELGLSASYTGSAATGDENLSMTGSTTFLTKPAKFYVFSDEANASCPSANPANADCSTPFKTAGETFNLKVRAACADNTKTPNFQLNGMTIGSNLIQPAGANPAALGIPTFNITGGEAVLSQTVSEVGVFTFTASLPVGGYQGETIIGSTPLNTSANIGRFTPHHFETAVVHACENSSSTPVFTYSGQPFTVTTYARNSSNTTTLNYRGNFALGVSLSDAAPASPALGTFANATIGSASFSSTSADDGSSYGVGTTTLANNFTYTFTSKETAPETIEIRATDSTDTAISSSGYTEGSTDIRSGRLRVENAFGPELQALNLPVKAEYYSTTGTPGFILNEDDSCSTYDATQGLLTNFTDNLSSGETTASGSGTVVNGQGLVSLSAPGSGNDGSVSLLLESGASPTWLWYDWNIDCDNADSDLDLATGTETSCGPYGTTTFGIYRGDDRVIYWREVF